jgi:hypothetical protein
MRISDLLQRKPDRIECDFSMLFGHYYCFVPEAEDHAGNDAWRLSTHDSPRIEIRIYKDHHYDHRRFWRLAAVYFDGEPVMITQNAGREGDDFHRRFIVDQHRYFGLVRAILEIPSKMECKGEPLNDLCSPDEDLGDALTAFYNAHLDQGYWERY